MPFEPPPFITVGDLLVDIADGLGQANKRLVDASASPVGTLAVKSADVTVTFDMTSSAIARDSTIGVGRHLGAKTLTLGLASATDQQETRVTNQAQIKLSIVSVAPQEPPPAKPATPDPVATPALPKPADPTADLLATIRVLRDAVKASRLSLAQKAEFNKGLDRAAKLVGSGDIAGAEKVIRDVTSRLRPTP